MGGSATLASVVVALCLQHPVIIDTCIGCDDKDRIFAMLESALSPPLHAYGERTMLK